MPRARRTDHGREKLQWKQEDDTLLLTLVTRRLPLGVIATTLGRTERAIVDRLHRNHHEFWENSGHPQSAPHLTKAGRETAPPTERLDRLERKIDRLTTMVQTLLQELGEKPSEEQHVGPNGVARA